MMRKFLILTFIIFLPIVVANNMIQTYKLELIYEYDHLFVDSVSVDSGYIPDKINIIEKGYYLELKNIHNEVEYDYWFDFMTEFSVSGDHDCIDGEDCSIHDFMIKDNAFEVINVPYSFIGKEINIYDSDGNLVSNIDISNYSNYCGDGICKAGESVLDCSEDCEEEIVKEEVIYDYREKDVKNRFVDNKALLISGILVLILIIILFLIKKRRS